MRCAVAVVFFAAAVAAAQDADEGLSSPYHYDRLHAERRLERTVRKDPAPLLALLRAGDSPPRSLISACRVAGRLALSETVAPLIALAGHPLVDVARAAVAALKRFPADRFKTLMAKYDSLSPPMRTFVLAAARKLVLSIAARQRIGASMYFYFPGQWKSLAEAGRAGRDALLSVLREAENGVSPPGVPLELLVYAAGDLGLKEAVPVLRRLLRKASGERYLIVSILALLGDDGPLEKEVKRLSAPGRGGGLSGAAHERLARLYHQARRYEEAEPHYRKAVAASPTDADLKTNLACLLSVEGKTAEAAALLREALTTKKRLSGVGAIDAAWQEWIYRDGELANLRKTEEFKKIAREFGLEPPEKKSGEDGGADHPSDGG